MDSTRKHLLKSSQFIKHSGYYLIQSSQQPLRLLLLPSLPSFSFTITKTKSERDLFKITEKKAARSSDSFPSIINFQQKVGIIVTVEVDGLKGMASGDNHYDIPLMLRSWADLGSATLKEDRVPSQSFFPF